MKSNIEKEKQEYEKPVIETYDEKDFLDGFASFDYDENVSEIMCCW